MTPAGRTALGRRTSTCHLDCAPSAPRPRLRDRRAVQQVEHDRPLTVTQDRRLDLDASRPLPGACKLVPPSFPFPCRYKWLVPQRFRVPGSRRHARASRPAWQRVDEAGTSLLPVRAHSSGSSLSCSRNQPKDYAPAIGGVEGLRRVPPRVPMSSRAIDARERTVAIHSPGDGHYAERSPCLDGGHYDEPPATQPNKSGHSHMSPGSPEDFPETNTPQYSQLTRSFELYSSRHPPSVCEPDPIN